MVMGYIYTDRDKAIQDAIQIREDSGDNVLVAKDFEQVGAYRVWLHDAFFKHITDRFVGSELDRAMLNIDSFYPITLFQPIFSDEEWENSPIESDEVWATRELAEKMFPGREIGAYTHDDIENPTIYRQ